MAPQTIVQLPYMHGSGLFAQCLFAGALLLDPGLPVTGAQHCGTGVYTPGEYPFGPAELAAIAAAMRDPGTLAHAGNMAVTNCQASLSKALLDSEMDELATLLDLECQRKHREDPVERLQAEQAQKLLLLAWLQEERQMEMDALAERYAECASRLEASLGDAGSSDFREKSAPAHAPDDGLLADWRMVAENAAFFLPDDVALAVTGPMREELLGNLEFREIRDGSMAGTLCCLAPLWQALGRTSPPQGKGRHGRSARKQRCWLVRS